MYCKVSCITLLILHSMAFQRSENISLNSRMVNDDLGQIWKERFLALLEMSRKFPGRIEERAGPSSRAV